MAKKDYYEILGLEKSASEDDIKKAYRKLAVQYHPDKNPGDKNAEEKFRQATEAYEILKDPDKRSKYDQFGHAAFDGAAGGGFGGFSTAGFDLSDALRAFMGDFGSDSIFNDIFGFGGSKRQSGNRSHGRRGNDLQIHLKLTLEEMYNGVQKKLKVRRKEACEPCKGSGSTSGNKANCTQCNGHGRVRHVANSMFGQVIQESICPSCQGEGKIVKDPCKSCSGGGRKTEETTVVVDIPAGVAEGNYLTVQGKGDAGLHGGQAGDLIVIIQEEKHDFFERHGIDVFCTIEISFSDILRALCELSRLVLEPDVKF